MARNPLSEIPQAIEDDVFNPQSVTEEMPDIDLDVPKQDNTPAAEVTKGTPEKDIFGKLMKLVIPAVAVAGGIWFFIPQEMDTPKEKPEAEVNEQVQEANTNSMIKNLQTEAEERHKQQLEAEKAEQEAAMMQSSAVSGMPVQGGGRIPTIPNVSGNGTVSTGGNLDSAQEAAIREGEVRASNLEASGNFKFIQEAANAIQNTFGGGQVPQRPSAHQMMDAKLGSQQQGGESSSPLSPVKANPNEAFRDRVQKDSVEPVVQKPAFAHNIDQQGTVVRTVLVTGVNSDMPGSLTAIVTSDVYDSTTGRNLMIPKGTKLIGQYNANVAVGQDRLMMAMTRMVLPDGTWISLAGAPGTDPIGQSGLEADVNNHFFRMFGASFMIGAASLLLPKDQRIISTDNIQGSGDISAGSIPAIALSEIISELMQRNRHIAPTLTIEPGTPFMFLVAKDMVMAPIHR